MEDEHGAVAQRAVPIDWEALEDAFENNAPEVHSYLHVVTGEVLRVVDGIADPEMHARIAADTVYLRIEPVSSREQYRWMERFIPMVEAGELRERLMRAIDGKGAFRRFKDVLMAHAAERERWFAFRSERLRVFMEAWLTAHALTAAPRPAPPPVVEPSGAELEQSAAGVESTGRSSQLAEQLRRRIQQASEGLPLRDLEKTLAFVEFLAARRGSRASYGVDESAEEHAPSSEERRASR